MSNPIGVAEKLNELPGLMDTASGGALDNAGTAIDILGLRLRSLALHYDPIDDTTLRDSAPWISWSRIPWMQHVAVPSEQREDSMGRRGYPAEFRQRVLDLVAAGRGVEDVARDLGISDQTIYSWRHQDRIDHGLEAGLTSAERAELLSARRRIHELETELAIHRRAAELLKGTTSPKGGSRQSR
jgi:transposase